MRQVTKGYIVSYREGVDDDMHTVTKVESRQNDPLKRKKVSKGGFRFWDMCDVAVRSNVAFCGFELHQSTHKKARRVKPEPRLV